MIKIGKKVSSTHFSSCNKERSEGCEAKKITWKYAVQDYGKRDGLSRRLALQHLHSEEPHFVKCNYRYVYEYTHSHLSFQIVVVKISLQFHEYVCICLIAVDHLCNSIMYVVFVDIQRCEAWYCFLWIQRVK
jgi:hypothetical protein